MGKKHELWSVLTNLKEFKKNLDDFVAPANDEGWSLSNLPTHFWETLGECINDVENYIIHTKRDVDVAYNNAINDCIKIAERRMLNSSFLDSMQESLEIDKMKSLIRKVED